MEVKIHWLSLINLHTYVLYPLQDVVLMRALRDMNLPKFVFEDVPLFLGLISDLFPGLDCPRVRYANFNDAVEHILQDNRYVLMPNQVFSLSLFALAANVLIQL